MKAQLAWDDDDGSSQRLRQAPATRRPCAFGLTTGVTTLLLSACGSEAASQSEARTVAAGIGLTERSGGCDILTAAEVSGLMGLKVKDVEISFGPGCSFDHVGGTQSAAFLQRIPGDTFSNGGFGATKFKNAVGLGDEAWIARGYQNSWSAEAKAGDKGIRINVTDPDERIETVTTLLKAALAKA